MLSLNYPSLVWKDVSALNGIDFNETASDGAYLILDFKKCIAEHLSVQNTLDNLFKLNALSDSGLLFILYPFAILILFSQHIAVASQHRIKGFLYALKMSVLNIA